MTNEKGYPRSELVEELRRLELCVTSESKFIPSEYLYDSVENRLELLRGLMDTDGYIAKDRTSMYFYTVSSRLCHDFRELVSSLGGKPRRTVKETGYESCNVVCFKLGI